MRRVVVVDGAEVGPRVLPPVVGDDRARPVRLPRPLVQAIVEAGHRLRQDAGEAEALVVGRPRDDRRVAAVARDRLLPLPLQPPLGSGRMRMKARHLAPDEKAQRVGPVQPPRVLDLLMLARAVEAE